MGQWTLAIDFGTCFTTAAYRQGADVTVLEIENSRYLPSLVCLGENDELLTGRYALQRAAQLPEEAERLPKRALVAGRAVLLRGRSVPATELVAAVLSRVYTEALAQHQQTPPVSVTLTHPAAWTERELALLGKAAQSAGISSPVLLPEPVAAAMHYAHEFPIPDGGQLAIYDLGGGTFDVALVCRTGDGFAVVGVPGGDPHIGGEDFDEALLALLREHALDRDPGPWERLWESTERTMLRQQLTLRHDVTVAREHLSASLRAPIHVPGYDDLFLIQRAEFEAAIDPLLRRTVDEFLRTVRASGLTPDQLAAVVLAGGASRTPRVSDLLSQVLGVPPRTVGDPKIVNVRGALVEAPGQLGSRPVADAGTTPARTPRVFEPDRDLFAE